MLTDPGLFKNEFEKNLYKKIHELRKYFIKYQEEMKIMNYL